MRQRPAGGHAARAGSTRCPTSVIRGRPVLSDRVRRRAAASTASSTGVEERLRRRRAVAGRAGERGRRAAGRDGRRRRRGSSAACRPRSRMYRAGAGPAPRRRRRHDGATPGARSSSSPRTTTSARRRPPRLLGLAVLDERGPRGRAPAGTPTRMASLRAGRARRRRRRVLDRAGRHPDRAGPPPRGDAHLRARPAARDRAGRRRCCAGAADMHVGLSRDPPRAERPRRAPRSTSARARSSASTTACRRTRTGGGSRWRGSGRPRATWTARSSCSTRPSACYVGDFSPDVRPVAALRARVLDRAGAAGRGARLGARARPVRRRRPRATCASSSTSRSPGCSSRRRTREPRRRPLAEATGAPGAPAARGRGGRADRQRDRDPRRAGARPPGARRRAGRARVARARARRWPSRRATSGSSSTKARRWRPCCGAAARTRTRPSYVRRLLAAFGDARAADRRPTSRLVEPLSERELEVLRLLGQRPRRPGHRPRARRVAEHRPDPHQEHLREARRQQPPGRRPPGDRARPARRAARTRRRHRRSARPLAGNHHRTHHVW